MFNETGEIGSFMVITLLHLSCSIANCEAFFVIVFFFTGKVKVFDNVEKRSMDGLTKRMIGIFSVGTYSYC